MAPRLPASDAPNYGFSGAELRGYGSVRHLAPSGQAADFEGLGIGQSRISVTFAAASVRTPFPAIVNVLALGQPF
jgi:hypothetical protein